jgi:hypothetical protein
VTVVCNKNHPFGGCDERYKHASVVAAKRGGQLMSEAVFQRASSGVREVLEDYAKRYPPSSHVTENLYEKFDGKYYKIEPADYYVA